MHNERTRKTGQIASKHWRPFHNVSCLIVVQRFNHYFVFITYGHIDPMCYGAMARAGISFY